MRHATAGLRVRVLRTPALGQTRSGITAARNAGNSAEHGYVDLANSYERESAAAVTSAPATGCAQRIKLTGRAVDRAKLLVQGVA